MLSNELEYCLNGSFHRARAEGHEYLTVEHLLLAILATPRIEKILRACHVDVSKLTQELTTYIDSSTPGPEDTETEVQPTLAFQRVLQRAVFHVQSSGRKEVGAADILIAVFSEKQSHAVYLLKQQNVTRLEVVNYISSGVARPSNPVSDATDDVEAMGQRVVEEATAALERRDDPGSPKLFISYSHVDQTCLDRLLVHLKPMHRSKAVSCWSDKSIRAGDKWRSEIKKNIEEAAIAILLVSADFLASDFIVNNELPPLLTHAEARGMRILPVILKPCGFRREPVLSSFQCINDPAMPLLSLDHVNQEALYDQIAEEVAQELRPRRA